jgi:heme-degrading monooxygenase HmoA
MCVHGFLRDIAQDADYEIYAVNNWWDDLEKFGRWRCLTRCLSDESARRILTMCMFMQAR